MDNQDLVLRRAIEGLVGPRPGRIPTDIHQVDRWVANARKQILLSEKHTRLKGAGLTWDDMRFPISRLTPSAAKPPTLTQLQGVFPVLAFSPIQENRVGGVAQMPHDWAWGSQLEFHGHWTPDTDQPAENIVWYVDYTWAPMGSSFPALTNVNSGPLAAPLSGAFGDAFYSDIADVIPPDTILPEDVSSIILFSLYRDGGVGDDDYTGNALLIEFDIHYQRDGFGSAQEDSKTWQGG